MKTLRVTYTLFINWVSGCVGMGMGVGVVGEVGVLMIVCVFPLPL